MIRAGILGAAALLAAATAAGAAPAIERGWPVRAPAGEVLPGPTGGPVVVTFGQDSEETFSVLAFGRRGTRLWTATRAVGCGNCDGAPRPRRQADGRYGPIGFTGDEPWSVDRRGRISDEACTGAVLDDGSCTESAFRFDTPRTSFVPQVRRNRAGTNLWTHEESDLRWVAESGPPRVFVDAAGISYVAFGPGFDATGQSTAPQRLLALTPKGGVFSRTLGGGEPLGAFRAGVLVRRDSSIARLSPRGEERWSARVPRTLGPIVDPIRNRVYVHDGRVLTARAASGGRILWRTSAHRLASIGPTGRVYVIDRRSGRHGVRALRWDGRLLWRHRTPRPVVGAAELNGRRAGISTVGNRLVVVNPARRR